MSYGSALFFLFFFLFCRSLCHRPNLPPTHPPPPTTTDLRQSIEEDFPPQQYNALERELKDHKGFAEMRTRVHVGGGPFKQLLDEYVFGGVGAGAGAGGGGERRPIVVCGESGCGKSALLANWVFALKKEQKGECSTAQHSHSTARLDYIDLYFSCFGEKFM